MDPEGCTLVLRETLRGGGFNLRGSSLSPLGDRGPGSPVCEGDVAVRVALQGAIVALRSLAARTEGITDLGTPKYTYIYMYICIYFFFFIYLAGYKELVNQGRDTARFTSFLQGRSLPSSYMLRFIGFRVEGLGFRV